MQGLTSIEAPWYEEDSVVKIIPKFKVKEGMMGQFMAGLPRAIELVKANEGGTCVHYGFVSSVLAQCHHPSIRGYFPLFISLVRRLCCCAAIISSSRSSCSHGRLSSIVRRCSA